MSMIIEELKLKNFEGYKQTEVNFTDGLNLIKGRNSTGKTTLLDALLFAFYGDIPGVHKKLLPSRLPGGDEMAVYIRFRSPRNGSVIEAYRSGSLDKKGGYKTAKLTLKIDGQEADVENDEELKRKITENLGISQRKFTTLVYVKQGRLQDILQPRKEDMDLILRLTVARELKEQMDEARRTFEKHQGKDVQTELQTLKTVILPQLQEISDTLDTEIPRLEEETKTLEEVIEKAESPQLTKLLNDLDLRKKSEDDLKEAENGVHTLLTQAEVKSRTELLKLREETEQRQNQLKEQCQSLENKVKESNEEWGSIRGAVSNLHDEIKRHQTLLEKGISTCPTCGQDLEQEKLEGILHEKQKKLQVLQNKGENARQEYNQDKKRFDASDQDLSEHTDKLRQLVKLENSIQSYNTQAETAKNKIKEYDEIIRGTLKVLSLPFEAKDPELKLKVAHRLPLDPTELETKKRYLERKRGDLQEKTERRRKAKSELEDKKRQMSDLTGRVKASELARKLSDRFDATIETRRRDVLKGIEVRTLFYYEKMTDQHDYDSIKIDPETYTVTVHPGNLVEYIPAMRDGGGHQTLLALAVRLALLETLGFRNLLILDEPTYGVDSENLPQLAEYFGEASRLIAQTILVTHHDICEEEASNIIEVSRGKDGASNTKVKF